MKKLLIILFILSVLLTNHYSSRDRNFSLRNYFNGEYIAYSADRTKGVDLGFCSMMYDDVDNEEIVGESITISNIEIISVLETLNAKLIKTECLDDSTIVLYAYSDKIKDSVKVDDQLVNLQIACKDSITVIGWPLILGSF